MNILRTSSAAALAVLGLAACSEGGAPAPAPASEGRLALGVQALTFPDVGDVAYHVAVRSALGPVWEADLRASRYGDGQSLSYVGPCDGSPAAQPHTVALRVDALYDAGGGALPASDWANPTAAGAIEVPAVCAPGEDVPVSFDLTLMRRASQGFFDIAVSFGEIFCSAKLDCEEDDHGPILLVHDPASGARVPTVVMALACVDPGATDLRLYLSDVALDCGFGPIAVDLSGGPGVLYDAADPAPAPILQALRFSGHQAYSDVGAGRSAEGAYVNLAVALDVDALDQRCTLAAEATAHDGALDDFTLPAASTYPVVTWQVDLTSPGEAGYSCTRHGLDDPDSGVGTAYKPAGATKTFAVVGHGDESDAFVLERRGGCTPSCAGRACGDDGCGGSCGSCDLGYCDLGVCNPDCSVALCGSGELAAPDGTCEPLSAPDDVVVSGTVLLDATSLTPGRAEPEQVSGRAKSVSGAIVTLTAAPPAGLAVGDEVLVINLMGSPAGVDRVGTHEIGLVAALDGPRVILTQPLRKVYATAGNSDLSAEVVRVVRVPVFRSLTLAAGAKLTASAFAPGGPGSGVVAVDVAGAVTFADASASISAAGLGYAGGAGGAHASGPNTVSNFGYPGTGLAGPATARGQAENEGGGGGGKSYLCGNYPGDCGGGGGGGGDYKSGAKGYPTGGGAQGGEGGARYAFDYDARWYLGAGGGGGAADPTGGGEAAGSGKNGTAGARGGGLVYVRAASVAGAGAVRADGADSAASVLSQPHEEGSGGAGAGGTVVFVGSFAAPATDVTGGQALNCDYCGGAGAAGRVVAEEGVQISPPTVAGDLTAANPGRWSDGAVAPSCAGYATPADSSYCAGTDSGVYLVDPDGGSAQNAYAVTCDFAAGTETRLCAEGYTGAACDTPVCEQSCENGGACAAPDTCGCTAGWTGTTCEEPVCAPSCQNGGTCAAPGECDCTGTGYAGAQCQTVDVTCPTTAECPTTSYPDASGECVPFAPGPDVTLVASANLSTQAITTGRTSPEGVFYKVTAIAGDVVTTELTPAGIAAGDEVLVVNLMGTPTDHDHVGVHELGVVASVSGTAITLVRPLAETYAAAGNGSLASQVVRVVRVPHFGSLTLRSGIALTTSAFSTSGGSGVLALHVDGALTVEVGASISADGAGYPGGAGGTPRSTVANSGNYGFAGTGIAGPAASVGSAQNFGGGGGGLSYKCGTNNSGDCGGGGGGGAHVGAGGGGSAAAGYGGGAGGSYASADDGRWYLGAGGGGGAADSNELGSDSASGVAGRAGGGLIFVRAGAIANGGTITARGGAGTAGASGSAEQGGGGAGGGGTVILAGATSAGAVTTSGGAVGTGTLPGGGGGAGRDVAPYALTVDGTLVAGNPGYWSDGAVAPYCAEYLLCATAGPGVYLVDPNGGDPSDAYETTCE